MMEFILDNLKTKDRKKVKQFIDTYINKKYSIDWNHIKLSRANGHAHNKMVCEICLWMLENNLPFATEVRCITHYTPDIISPLHIKPIIEVRNTETDKRTQEKFSRIPDDLMEQIIYVDAKQEFYSKLIL